MATYRIPIDLTWTGATGSPGVNIWHGRDAVGQDDGAALDGLSTILEAFYETLRPIYYVDAHMAFAGEAQGVGDDTGDTYTEDAWSLTGSGNQGFAPPADCMLVQWATGTGGRHGRGRTFIGPLDLANLEANGTPVEAKRTVVQGAIDDLIEAVDTFGNGALGVYSRTENVFRDFTSGACANYFAVLRSRRD